LKEKKFDLVQWSIEILDKFSILNNYPENTISEVIKAFWLDNKEFGGQSTFSFKYMESPQSDFEKGCKTLGDSLIEGYTKFTTKVEKGRKVRDNFISEYFSNSNTNRCQFCGQFLEFSGKVEGKITADLEHILPKSKFPQFALHPNNLVPCCLECNQREKGDKFFDNLEDFNKALEELNIKMKNRPLELYKKFIFRYNENLELECSIKNKSKAMEFIKLYGLDTRYKKMLGQCFSMLLTQIRIAKISDLEALERFLEHQLQLSFTEYKDAPSFNNSPHLWQDFLNEILYCKARLEALWDEVKDNNIRFFE
jgi:hypothetical protein